MTLKFNNYTHCFIPSVFQQCLYSHNDNFTPSPILILLKGNISSQETSAFLSTLCIPLGSVSKFCSHRKWLLSNLNTWIIMGNASAILRIVFSASEIGWEEILNLYT